MWNFLSDCSQGYLEIEGSSLDASYSVFSAKYKVDQIKNDEMR